MWTGLPNTRRQFLKQTASVAIGPCLFGSLGFGGEPGRIGHRAGRQQDWISRPQDHLAVGASAVVTSTSKEASEAALEALALGGNACDAYLTAALTQTVVEHGLTSIAGGFSIHFFDAAHRKTSATVGALGPAKDEPYDFERESPVTQTGRAIPVPGFLSGLFSAHQQHGRLRWSQLFEPAIRYALEGFPVSPLLVRAAATKAARFPEGAALWRPNGRFLKTGERLIQPALGQTLQAIAAEGPDAFYTGAFAESYVARARSDGGRLTMQDMATWRERSQSKEIKPEGQYRGHQVLSGGLIVYAWHLAEALDLQSLEPPKGSPESVLRQYRIMEEVFHATREYSPDTHEQYLSPEFARDRAEFVLTSPLRRMTFDSIFNTCFLAVRDRDGNVAWGTHSINTPTAFGAGILVDGVYAAHAMNRAHVSGTGGNAPGISTSVALFRDGTPELIAGSPGFGFVHGPWQFGLGVKEWGLSPADSLNQPRFGLPRQDGNVYFEDHYDKPVFAMLTQKGIPFFRGRPSPFTGLVGALVRQDDGNWQAVQDGRVDGFALASD